MIPYPNALHTPSRSWWCGYVSPNSFVMAASNSFLDLPSHVRWSRTIGLADRPGAPAVRDSVRVDLGKPSRLSTTYR
jgi:hypothetical protein